MRCGRIPTAPLRLVVGSSDCALSRMAVGNEGLKTGVGGSAVRFDPSIFGGKDRRGVDSIVGGLPKVAISRSKGISCRKGGVSGFLIGNRSILSAKKRTLGALSTSFTSNIRLLDGCGSKGINGSFGSGRAATLGLVGGSFRGG